MKNNISIQDDVVVKKINKNFINISIEWFEFYKALAAKNKYLVKVLDIDIKRNILYMENLGNCIHTEACLKDPYLKNRATKEIVCDIIIALNTAWSDSIEFSKSLQGNEFFVHTDLSLDNIVLTPNNKIKVIDPDSFQLIDKLLYTEKFYMSQINLMANLGIYYNDL